MSKLRVNAWLPQAAGLLAAATVAVLISAPPAHPFNWLTLIGAALFSTAATWVACSAVMFLAYVALPVKDPGPKILRTASIAACLAPLVFLLQERSLWAPVLAAFIVCALMPIPDKPKPYWIKFAVSFVAGALLQVGIGAEIGKRILLSTLILAIASIPIVWRIRQERKLPGPLKPRQITLTAFVLAIFSLMHYLPIRFTSGAQAASLPDLNRSVHVGGKYRGVILIPEPEKHVSLIVPLPMMGRDPFLVHKDPIGIPFYGVYWFYQFPDKHPDNDAYKIQGSPDKTSFRSTDRTALNMEARQNLGRLIETYTLKGIDIAIHNADPDTPVGVELLIVNMTQPPHPYQSLGRVEVGPEPKQTLHFPMPPIPSIHQFDELSIRFIQTGNQATRSAKIAIERFFLVPRR